MQALFLPQVNQQKLTLAIVTALGITLLTGCQYAAKPASKSSSTTAKITLTDTQKTQLNMQAKQTIKPFAQELLGTVKKTVKSSGYPKAINACQTLAPTIANKHSEGDWKIGRTSNKIRNPNNAPDAWETKVLAQFAQQVKAGADIQSLEYGEVVGTDYRYMKAIGVKPPCLACHGNNIKPTITAELAQRYPSDAATGYQAGDLRGAFTLIKPLQ